MTTAIKIILALILIILFSACDKNENDGFMGEGVITGYDQRDCACCGGLLINLNSNLTALYTDSTYQIDKVPEDFFIDVNTNFPVFIRLDYSRNTKLCGKTIDILKYALK